MTLVCFHGCWCDVSIVSGGHDDVISETTAGCQRYTEDLYTNIYIILNDIL